jgi:two-component system NtrC family sensor kinase
VFFRGLRTKIATNIAILLFVGMLLIDLVTMVTAKRELVRSEVSRAGILVAYLEDQLRNTNRAGGLAQRLKNDSFIKKMIGDSKITGAIILAEGGEQINLGRQSDVSLDNLVRLTKTAISTGEKSNHFYGTTWGMFWKQKSGLILSAPLIKEGVTRGGVSIILSLESLYQTLRNTQQILFIYIFINLVILTFIGIYRISKLYLKPLTRLAKRAEDYKEDDEIIFSVRKEDNELNRLSKALNVMLNRISADREKLRSTVLSLENTNLELKKAQREIIRAEKLASVGRLSAGIAHEIGNPLGIVIGYLELLKQKDVTENEKVEYIHRTEEEIERINKIIGQLLEVSRPSNSGRKAISVHGLIHDTADVVSVQPLMSNIELKLNLTAVDDTVLADPNQLRQVFLNLIINAADAISCKGEDSCGKLEIATELERDTGSDDEAIAEQLKIMFIDNGPGIAEEALSNIFDPFFTTKDPGRGTGLGLSVSFMIVESLNGKVTGVSEVDKGTTMIICLPLYRPADPPQQIYD